MKVVSRRDGNNRGWPGYLFGGRVRTSTFALLVAFFATWWLYYTYSPSSTGPTSPETQVVPPGFVPDPEYTWVPRTKVEVPRPTTTTPTTTAPTTTTPTTTTETTEPTMTDPNAPDTSGPETTPADPDVPTTTAPGPATSPVPAPFAPVPTTPDTSTVMPGPGPSPTPPRAQ